MLKKIDQMTHEEIIALTEDDLQSLIEIDCAEAGIKILPRPKKPVEPTMDAMDKQACWVFPSVVLIDRDAVDALESCVKSIKDSAIKTHDSYVGIAAIGADGYARVPTGKPFAFVAETSTLVNSNQMSEYKKLENDFSMVEKEYKAAMNLFNSSKEELEDIANPITQTYATHKEIEYNINSLKNKLKRFLSLAKGDKEICMRFFLNTYSVEYSEASSYFQADVFIDELLEIKQQELTNANEKDSNLGQHKAEQL